MGDTRGDRGHSFRVSSPIRVRRGPRGRLERPDGLGTRSGGWGGWDQRLREKLTQNPFCNAPHQIDHPRTLPNTFNETSAEMRMMRENSTPILREREFVGKRVKESMG